MAELSDFELDENTLKQEAGGMRFGVGFAHL